jgi:hypothetical protein
MSRRRQALVGVALVVGVALSPLLGVRPVLATPGDNVLSAADSTFLDGSCTAGNWIVGWNLSIATVTTPADGDGCALRLTATTNSDMAAKVLHAAVAGAVYTATAKARAATTVRSGYITLDWYSSAGCTTGYLSSGNGSPVSDSASVWTTWTMTATAPATTQCVYLNFRYTASANGELHYADTVTLTSPTVDPNPTTTTTTTVPPTTTTTVPPTTTTTVPPTTTTTVPPTTTTTVPSTTTTTTSPPADPCSWEHGGVVEADPEPCGTAVEVAGFSAWGNEALVFAGFGLFLLTARFVERMGR